MSLRRCPECHKKVSTQAAHSVKCGYPFIICTTIAKKFGRMEINALLKNCQISFWKPLR